ncbi:AAA family ATPase [Tenacibaculum sp. MAR_2009_124]|uniref:AAA family ATPase n=1 Tax=Tenacibaculum sp. MAR_2009_124 TaxID=1250059 RepID=UPI0015A02079|nr:AAA family ATPase [Tenacibaculum sp. MAR_2009_124]
MKKRMGKIHIVFGPQGVGKSTYSKKLTDEVQGIHLSIDDWMWRLYGDDLPKSMSLKWIMERVERCEKQIWELAKSISDRKCDVILDFMEGEFHKPTESELTNAIVIDTNPKE